MHKFEQQTLIKGVKKLNLVDQTLQTLKKRKKINTVIVISKTLRKLLIAVIF